MKKIIGLFFLLIIIILLGFYFSRENNHALNYSKNQNETQFKNGDIIFQTSESKQCEAVRIATNSKFSHCGIIYIENDKTFVYEAVQPVKMTLLKDWISHGKESKYIVKRLKNDEKILTSKIIEKMKLDGKRFINKNYDIYFEWSDENIYCSELVWKIYKECANIELCSLKKLKDFNLNHPIVKNIMNQRYGDKIPLEENVVAPSQLHDSKLLTTIFNNY